MVEENLTVHVVADSNWNSYNNDSNILFQKVHGIIMK